ncbi:MAG: hypothetical protein Q9162_000143 [Coniocarpon cinnabarinum]
MPLTVLSDDDVRTVLEGLSKGDVHDMHCALADALHSYSTSTEPASSGCCSSNQPKRLQVKLTSGATTLFMPSVADNGVGIKVVTLSEGTDIRGQTKNLPNRGAESPVPSSPVSARSPTISRDSTTSGSETPRSHSPSLRQSTTNTSTSSASNITLAHRSSTSSTNSSSLRSSITQPSGSNVPLPSPSSPQRASHASSTSPTGTLTLLTPEGHPRAILSASTLTAFRTALASTFLLMKRRHCHSLTVFGAGRQAEWHINLALLLRGQEIHHLYLINRSFERAGQLYKSLAEQRNAKIQSIFLEGKLRPEILTPDFVEYSRLAKEAVRSSDVIFCCTPSTEPLFPHSWLTNTEGRKKARYIAAIGSYKPHMAELPVEILQQAVRSPDHGSHHIVHAKAASEGGAVVVDTIEGAMREAGEIIRSGIGGQGVVELGELVMLKRSHWVEKHEREEKERQRRERAGGAKDEGGGHGISHLFRKGASKRNDSVDKRRRGSGSGEASSRRNSRSRSRNPREGMEVEVSDGGLQEWLQRGNVVYKSVGIGLMDVVVGLEIVRLAEERGIGTTFEGFN